MSKDRVDPAVLRVADAVGALIEGWGFKRNMGRMWAVLYLEDHPLTAADLGGKHDSRRKLIADRIAGLVQLSQVGIHLLEAVLEGESIDALPLTTIGELAKKT
jgi:DNA-binding transcriptional regulator GbsR (MarR family)